MSDSKDDDQNYDVGYKKPPTNTQFKKGQSGNSKGRPKGSKNMSTILKKELNVAVSVTKLGKRQKTKKKELIITQLTNQAASGNLKAIAMILSEDRQLQDSATAAAPALTFKPTDEIVQNAFLSRLKESLIAEIAQEQITRSIETKTSQESSHEND
jgi:hypothetical protein